MRTAEILDGGWPDREEASGNARRATNGFGITCRRLNPGTTADLVTAALYAALRDGTIALPARATLFLALSLRPIRFSMDSPIYAG